MLLLFTCKILLSNDFYYKKGFWQMTFFPSAEFREAGTWAQLKLQAGQRGEKMPWMVGGMGLFNRNQPTEVADPLSSVDAFALVP